MFSGDLLVSKEAVLCYLPGIDFSTSLIFPKSLNHFSLSRQDVNGTSEIYSIGGLPFIRKDHRPFIPYDRFDRPLHKSENLSSRADSGNCIIYCSSRGGSVIPPGMCIA